MALSQGQFDVKDGIAEISYRFINVIDDSVLLRGRRRTLKSPQESLCLGTVHGHKQLNLLRCLQHSHFRFLLRE